MSLPSSVTKIRLNQRPIPVSIPGQFRPDWLAAAAKLNGKSLHTAVALGFLAGLHQEPGVRLTRRTMQKWSLSRDAFYDAIRRLEDAKLIRVWRLPGRSHHVILMEPDQDKPLDLALARHSRFEH